MATWHSNYLDYLKYYYLEGILGPALKAYLEAFYNQIPAVYAPVRMQTDMFTHHSVIHSARISHLHLYTYHYIFEETT